MEFAEITNLRPMIMKQCQLRDSRRLVRVASDADLTSYKAKVARENLFMADARTLASEKRMTMKLVRAEESFDGRKLSVYYTSENRIDYRQLVAELAGHRRPGRDAADRGPGRDQDAAGGSGPAARRSAARRS